jgi:predicted deacylase
MTRSTYDQKQLKIRNMLLHQGMVESPQEQKEKGMSASSETEVIAFMLLIN